MLESKQAARGSLERGLAELEALGLVRPANVLMAEYLRTLTAEDVLDLATADQLSAAYNRVRYSAADDDDPQVGEAVAALDRVAQRLAAMSPHERQQIALRIRERIESPPTEQFPERDTERLADAHETAVPPTRQTQTARPDYVARTSGKVIGASELSDPLDSLAASLPAANRGGSSLRRISIELAALVTFFGGYFFRDSVNKVAEVGGDDRSSSPSPLSARDAWKNTELWVEGLQLRAGEEAQSHRYGKARLAFELGIAYSPNNASMLNDLAALYLQPDETGTTNPKRALELAQRALEYTHQPTVLDTAAEAQFQCGKIDDAIRLEEESLTRAFESGEEDNEFRKYRQKQLRRFQDASQIRTAEQAPLSPNGLGPPRVEPGGIRAEAPLPNSLGKPAGS